MSKQPETREERQIKLDARVAELRAEAAKLMADSTRIYDATNKDGAFWTQPAQSNAAGRAFANQRERERDRLHKAAVMSEEASALLRQAAGMEARGAVMAGDAATEKAAAAAALQVSVGQNVKTIYGVRKVIKVNTKTILIEGAFGPISVPKHLARVA